MSASSSRSGIEPDDNNSIACQSIANYETNWDDKDLVNWQLPNIQQYSIYRKSRTLDFRTLLGQKTKEINVKFHNNSFSTNLLNKNSLNHYHKLGYNDLHIGSVQIGLKPLAKIGLNNSLLVVLRDKRITNYKESILGIAETSLTYGPIYFQCYPNFTIALNSDEHKEKCLVIDIQTHNYQFLKGSSPYKLIYRIHYRVLTTGLIPSYIPPVIPAGQTICYNACPTVNLMVPTPVKWEDINFPETWLKEHADHPTYRPPMRNLRDCISDQDGTLRISFRDRSLSSRELMIRLPVCDEEIQSARNSLSSFARHNIRNQIPSLVEQDQYRPIPNTTNQLPSLENRYKPGTSEVSEPINLVPR